MEQSSCPVYRSFGESDGAGGEYLSSGFQYEVVVISIVSSLTLIKRQTNAFLLYSLQQILLNDTMKGVLEGLLQEEKLFGVLKVQSFPGCDNINVLNVVVSMRDGWLES